MESHVLAMCLRRAYLAFHRQVNAWTLKYGITADQFVMLRVAAREPGLTQIEIVERTASDPNTVAAILRLLEERGLIRRKPHATDGRARCVFLTSRGRKLQQRAYEESDPLRVALAECAIPGDRHQNEQFLHRVHDKFLRPIAETNTPPARLVAKGRPQRALRRR
jgi:DNA-binding MarR family transcriptional regulator